MISIGRPFIEHTNGYCYLCSHVKDSNSNKQYKLWYSVDSCYEEYVCYEVADAFLLGVLQVAMSTQQDIVCDAPVSSKFLFHLRNNLMAMLCRIIPNSRKIQINAKATDIQFNSKGGVGCGCSLGVDSFSSLLRHLKDDITDGYKVTHLTLFNTGHFGTQKLEEARKAFREAEKELLPFSKEIGLPIVAIDTNLNDIYLDYEVTFLQSITQRTVSAAMVLQKLFGRYIIASAYLFDKVYFTSEDLEHAEVVIVPLLSTNNMEVVLSNSELTRVQKTELIVTNPLVQKYLNVCWSTHIANMYDNSFYLDGKIKKNCGKCDKCLRTLFTIELLGELDHYGDIFDLQQYQRYRQKFIIKVLSLHNENSYYDELYQLMKQKDFKVDLKTKILVFFVKMGVYKFMQKVFKLTTMNH